jgi:hypothetical protein
LKKGFLLLVCVQPVFQGAPTAKRSNQAQLPVWVNDVAHERYHVLVAKDPRRKVGFVKEHLAIRYLLSEQEDKQIRYQCESFAKS